MFLEISQGGWSHTPLGSLLACLILSGSPQCGITALAVSSSPLSVKGFNVFRKSVDISTIWKWELPSLQLIFLYVSFRVVLDSITFISISIRSFCGKHAVQNPFRCALGMNILNYKRWHTCCRKHALKVKLWKETIPKLPVWQVPTMAFTWVHMSRFSCVLCHRYG